MAIKRNKSSSDVPKISLFNRLKSKMKGLIKRMVKENKEIKNDKASKVIKKDNTVKKRRIKQRKKSLDVEIEEIIKPIISDIEKENIRLRKELERKNREFQTLKDNSFKIKVIEKEIIPIPKSKEIRSQMIKERDKKSKLRIGFHIKGYIVISIYAGHIVFKDAVHLERNTLEDSYYEYENIYYTWDRIVETYTSTYDEVHTEGFLQIKAYDINSDSFKSYANHWW